MSPKLKETKGIYMEFWQAVMTGLITGAFSAGSIWGVLSSKLQILQKEIDRTHERINRHEEMCHKWTGVQ